MLDAEEFALSMHLINIKLDGWVTLFFFTKKGFQPILTNVTRNCQPLADMENITRATIKLVYNFLL